MNQQQPNPYRAPQILATTPHTPWLARVCVYAFLSAVGIWLAAMLVLGTIALLPSLMETVTSVPARLEW